MLVRSLIAALLVVQNSVLAKDNHGLHRKMLERRQTADAFFQAPANLQSLKAGTIIRSRSITYPNAPLDSEAYQLVFRTASPNNTALAGVTTVIFPKGFYPDQLVSYSLAQDGSATKCAPSASLPAGLAGESAFLTGFLNRRWAITTADYYGPDAAFTAGRLAGQITLDAIRATLAFKPKSGSGFAANARVNLVGYSSGAYPVAWAASLHPTYAKDLNLVGAAFGGAPTNLPASISYLDGSPGAGFVVATVGGLAKAYKPFNDRLGQILTPAGRAAIDLANTQCTGDNLNAFANQTWRSTKYQSLGSLFVVDPVIGTVYQRQVLGKERSETPSIPLLVIHASNDKIVPVQMIEGTVNSWCWNGIKSLEFVRNTGKADHMSQYLLSMVDILNFVGARFSGQPATPGCKNRFVNYSLGKRQEFENPEEALAAAEI